MDALRFAIKQTIPIWPSYIFVGIAFGILMNGAGYSVIWICMAAFFIYAGSMQMIMITLLVSGVPLYMIALMTFFINARHIFYGIRFIERFKKMGWRYPYMALTLTDETYSILCSIKYREDIDEKQTDFYVMLVSHLLWVVSCTIGAIFGDIIPFDMTGIEFSATAFFTTVCVNQWRQVKSHVPAIVGAISAVLFYFILGPDNFILPALSLSLIALVILKGTVENKLKEAENDA